LLIGGSGCRKSPILLHRQRLPPSPIFNSILKVLPAFGEITRVAPRLERGAIEISQ
jgi:hypothetical protein